MSSVKGRDGGNGEIPRHNRGKAGAMLVELALMYIIWERSHMRVTGDRDGSPPRCYRLTVELNHKLALAAIASASYATASSLKAQAVNHNIINIVARHTITGGERKNMEVLKETDSVIIYKNKNGLVSYRFKVKDAERIIEAEK